MPVTNQKPFLNSVETFSETALQSENEKLKSELLAVITLMETRLVSVKEKRRQRIAQEMQANSSFYGRASQIKKGARKFNTIKEKVDLMWRELEHTHNIAK